MTFTFTTTNGADQYKEKVLISTTRTVSLKMLGTQSRVSVYIIYDKIKVAIDLIGGPDTRFFVRDLEFWLDLLIISLIPVY